MFERLASVKLFSLLQTFVCNGRKTFYNILAWFKIIVSNFPVEKKFRKFSNFLLNVFIIFSVLFRSLLIEEFPIQLFLRCRDIQQNGNHLKDVTLCRISLSRMTFSWAAFTKTTLSKTIWKILDVSRMALSRMYISRIMLNKMTCSRMTIFKMILNKITFSRTKIKCTLAEWPV
jgi:hypothetical protein